VAFQSFVVLVFIWLGDGSRLNKSCLHYLGVPYHHCYRVSSPFLVEFISFWYQSFGSKISFVYLDGDQGTTSKDLIQVPIGPVTRARAKKFKDVLNGLIQELWAQANSGRPIEHDPQRQQRIVTLIQVLEG
jgi:hypothetical protein